MKEASRWHWRGRGYTGAAVPEETTPQANTSDNSESAQNSSPEAAESSAAAKDPLATAQAELERVRDQLLRTAADFDNFRKRSRRESQDAERRAREDVLKDLLPVFDNFERAAQHAGSATDIKSLAEGVTMVMRIFLDTLAKLGVERIQSLGQPFDPAVHEAVQQLATNEHPAGSVVAEIAPGYRMGERLLRPAMVVVAKPAAN